MAIDTILRFDRTTAANNVDVDGVGIQGSSPISSGNDAIQSFMKLIGAALTRRVAKSGGATAAMTDHAQFWDFTAAATLSLTAAATLTDGWCLLVKATGGAVVIDPNSTETIDGATTITLNVGQSAMVICNGTGFYTLANTEQVAFPAGHLFGLTMSNNASDATNDIDVTVGECRDASDSANIVLATALTKRLDAAWAVGSGNGMLATGASIANGTYHLFAILRPDTGVVDIAADTSATGANIAANTNAAYTKVRRIGSIIRASGAILGFSQVGDAFHLTAEVTEVSSTAATGWATVTLSSVPAGIVVRPIFSGRVSSNSGATTIIVEIASGNQPSTPTSALRVAELPFGSDVTTWNTNSVKTNTSAQIYRRAVLTSGTLAANTVNCHGWFDIRGRMA